MHIDLQRLLNYLLLLLAVAGGVVTGMLAGRLVDLSLGGNELLLSKPMLPEAGDSQLQEADLQAILDRNLFNSAAAGQAGQVDLSLAEIPGQEQQAVRTAPVDLQLIGTVAAGKDSLALLQVGKKVDVYRLDAEIAPGVVLVAVERTLVVVRDHGVERRLVLDESKQPTAKVARLPQPAAAATDDGIVALGDNHWQISRSASENARKNFNKLLTTARMVPQVENGKTIGFRLLEMVKNSLLEKLGLQVGDVLVEINQVVLDSPEKALQVFQQVREASNISLGLVRDGERKTFEYSFE